jgi:poly-gamma-glutamate biosynthesis protein PgsC/CapC
MQHLFVGIVVSLLVSETTGYSPGGIVAAGYLSLFFGQPSWLAATALCALATYGIVRVLETQLLLFGRRLFAVYVLVGLIVSQLAMMLSRGGAFFDWGIIVIGYLIPGLIARDFGRQGVVSTFLVTALAVVLTKLIILAGDGWLW